MRFLTERVAFLSVLGNRDFRFYSVGLIGSVLGQQMLTATQAWLVYYITGSPAAIGLVGAAHAIPGMVLSLVGGAFADRFNPRTIIMVSQGISSVAMAALATLVITGRVEVWHIVFATIIIGITQGFDSPARRTVWPPLVRRDQFVYAISLSQATWNGLRIIAPGFAGLIIATVGRATGDEQAGAGASLYVTLAGFLSMTVAMYMVRMPPIQRSSGATVGHDIIEGLAFVVRNRVYTYLLGVSLIAGYFGLSYLWLMPVLAEENFHVGADGYGALLSAGGVGALIGVLAIASFGQYQDRPWLLIGSMTVAGGGVVALAVVSAVFPSFYAGLALMVLTGGAFASFQVATGTSVNLLVPDEYRGRVMGLRGTMFNLAPLGSLQAGLLATAVGTPFAIGLGGAVLVVAAIAAYVLSPEIRNLRQLVATSTADSRRS